MTASREGRRYGVRAHGPVPSNVRRSKTGVVDDHQDKAFGVEVPGVGPDRVAYLVEEQVRAKWSPASE